MSLFIALAGLSTTGCLRGSRARRAAGLAGVGDRRATAGCAARCRARQGGWTERCGMHWCSAAADRSAIRCWACLHARRLAGHRGVAHGRSPTTRDCTGCAATSAHVDGLPARVDAIFSCGPLDAFARLVRRVARSNAARVIAFGSTSVEVKRGSADAARARRRAAPARRRGSRVRRAPARAAPPRRCCDRRWSTAPAAMPRSRASRSWRSAGAVSRCRAARTACASRCTSMTWPQPRSPAIDSAATHGQAYALPGGETLTYRDMVARVLAALQPPPTLVELPSPLFNLALLARAADRARHRPGRGGGAAHAQRPGVRPAPAQRDFGYAPRPFRPRARHVRAARGGRA